MLEFRDTNGGINTLDYNQLKDMSLREFATYRGALMNVRNERRFDKAIALGGTTILERKAKKVFRKGIGEEDVTFDGTPFIKDDWHTNMLKSGEFETGDFAVITNLEIEFPRFGGKPKTQGIANSDMGKVTNAQATFPPNYDPALVDYSFLNQLWVQLVMGKTTILEGRAIDFIQSSGISAAYGSNSGAYVDNGGNQKKFLEQAVPIDGGMDFGVILTPQASFDLTAAGINETLVLTVVLDTVELQRIK